MAVTEAQTEAVIEYLAAMEPTNLRREIDARRSQADDLERTIVTCARTIAGYRRQAIEQQALIDAALAAMGMSNWAEHLVAEFRQVAEHPRIIGVRKDGDCVVLTTTDDLRLHRPDTGDSRWLGTFEIEIDLHNMRIRMRNLSTKRGGRDHPHVVDNDPCFGGHSSSFMQLLSNGDLFILTELLIQYIETLNLEDEYGRYGSYWFEVTDAELGAPPEHCLDGSAEAVAA